jgi:hypothetical protein
VTCPSSCRSPRRHGFRSVFACVVFASVQALFYAGPKTR